MKVNKQQLITVALAGIISGLVVVWLTPLAKKTPPTDYRGT